MYTKTVLILSTLLCCLNVNAQESLIDSEWGLNESNIIDNKVSETQFKPKNIKSFNEKYGHNPYFIGSSAVLLSAFYLKSYDDGSDAAKADALLNLLMISVASGYVIYTSLNNDTKVNLVSDFNYSTSIVLNHNF